MCNSQDAISCYSHEPTVLNTPTVLRRDGGGSFFLLVLQRKNMCCSIEALSRFLSKLESTEVKRRRWRALGRKSNIDLFYFVFNLISSEHIERNTKRQHQQTKNMEKLDKWPE